MAVLVPSDSAGISTAPSPVKLAAVSSPSAKMPALPRCVPSR
nr:hypothetical protein [Streptomyces sp. SLBN-115]